MFLVLATFSAVLFGTFATRSGVIESVHSFARSEIGFPMLTFWAVMTLIGLVLLLWRWNQGKLEDEHEFAGLLSRESLFVMNNVIFMALTIAIFWGSFGAPITSELFLGTEISLGADYFMQVTPPLFAALYLLMGVAPLSAWSSTSLARLGSALLVPAALTLLTVTVIALTSPATVASTIAYAVVFLAGYVALYEIYRGAAARVRARNENPLQALFALFRRNQRRYGGYMVHLGVTVIGIGVIGSTIFQYETRRPIEMGQTINVQDYQVTYTGFEQGRSADGRMISRATLNVSENGQPVATLNPRIDGYPEMNMTIAGAHSTLERDFYVLLAGTAENNNIAVFEIYINPLVNLVWWGGLVLILGTFLAAWPKDIVPEHIRERTLQRQINRDMRSGLVTS
jgi:cytochrome c-type biogenesis protein CcmF